MRLSVIVPTIGRASLSRSLESLKEQLGPADEVLLTSDGTASEATRTAWRAAQLPGQLLEIPDGPHNDWGNTARTYAVQFARGTHCLYLDDDDTYAPGALAKVKQALMAKPTAMHVFQTRFASGNVIWKHPFLRIGEVSTGQFCHPTDAALGSWGSRYEGDYDFIRSTIILNPGRDLVWVPEVITLFRTSGSNSGKLDPINCLWVGKLTQIERLSLTSYVHIGHPVNLYTYGDAGSVPTGVTVLDANKIIPESDVFQYRYDWFQQPNYAVFADCFRFKLLSEQGGWWSDLDVVCLRPYEFDAPYVIPSYVVTPAQVGLKSTIEPNNTVLKAPAGKVMAAGWERSRPIMKQSSGNLVGPLIMAELVREFQLEQYLVPPALFCAVSYMEWRRFLANGPEQCKVSQELRESYGAHLWNEMWVQDGIDKNKQFHPVSQIEIWKRHLLKDYWPA